jgi:hypothetical protein
MTRGFVDDLAQGECHKNLKLETGMLRSDACSWLMASSRTFTSAFWYDPRRIKWARAFFDSIAELRRTCRVSPSPSLETPKLIDSLAPKTCVSVHFAFGFSLNLVSIQT